MRTVVGGSPPSGELLPSLSPVLEAGDPVPWPTEFKDFDTHNVGFWELEPLPVGSVLTFTVDSDLDPSQFRGCSDCGVGIIVGKGRVWHLDHLPFFGFRQGLGKKMGSEDFLPEQEICTPLSRDRRLHRGARSSRGRVWFLARGDFPCWLCGEASTKVPGRLCGGLEERRRSSGGGEAGQGEGKGDQCITKVGRTGCSKRIRTRWKGQIRLLCSTACQGSQGRNFEEKATQEPFSSGEGRAEGLPAVGEFGEREITQAVQRKLFQKDSGFGSVCCHRESTTTQIEGPGTNGGAGSHRWRGPMDRGHGRERKRKRKGRKRKRKTPAQMGLRQVAVPAVHRVL